MYSWHFVGVVYYRTQGKVKDISHLNLAVEGFSSWKALNVISSRNTNHRRRFQAQLPFHWTTVSHVSPLILRVSSLILSLWFSRVLLMLAGCERCVPGQSEEIKFYATGKHITNYKLQKMKPTFTPEKNTQIFSFGDFLKEMYFWDPCNFAALWISNRCLQNAKMSELAEVQLKRHFMGVKEDTPNDFLQIAIWLLPK